MPAGNTPIPLYENWEKHKPDFLKSLKLIQIDEVLFKKPYLFQSYFKKNLPSYQNQIDYINEAEKFADLALLGLGLNGHVGFHEPGISNSFFSGCLKLSSETVEQLKLEAPREKDNHWGVTYGLNAFMKCRSVALVVRGASKDKVLQSVLEGDKSYPASELIQHKSLFVFKQLFS